jgi:ligand-binding sensor domain-containing protein
VTDARALALVALLALVGEVSANGGGHVLTPPPDFTEIAPGSVEVVLPEVNVAHAVEDGGTLWAATDKGLGTRAPGGAWTWLDSKSGHLPADAPVRVARFQGRTWVGLATQGVARVAAQGKGFERFGASEGLPSGEIVDMVVHKDQLWVLTAAGLARFDGARFAPAPNDGAPKGVATTLCSGLDGALWIGTDQAQIAAFNGTSWTVHGFDGLIVGRTIRAVAAFQGQLWFGTYGSLNAFKPDTGRLDDETAEKAVLFPTRLIKAIAASPERLLVATGGGGLYRFDLASHQWHLYTDTNGLPSLTINAISLHGAHLLVSSIAGLARIDLAKPLPGDLRREKEEKEKSLSSPSPREVGPK